MFISRFIHCEGIYSPLQVKNQLEGQVKNMIVNYRDDADLQNLVDWVQQDWVSLRHLHTVKIISDKTKVQN